MAIANLKAKIKTAFASVEPPPHWCITDSNEGEEPALLQQEFAEILHWESLSPTFLNQTPDGYSSALGFFSDEAICPLGIRAFLKLFNQCRCWSVASIIY